MKKVRNCSVVPAERGLRLKRGEIVSEVFMSTSEVQLMVRQPGESSPALTAPGGPNVEDSDHDLDAAPPSSEGRRSFIRQIQGNASRDAIVWLASVGAPGNLRVSAEMGQVVTRLLDVGYSFRRLAAQPGVTSSATLFRAVRIFQLSQAVGGFESFRHVGVGHASCVLSLPSEVQCRLLQTAERERWSRTRLRAEARQASVATPDEAAKR